MAPDTSTFFRTSPASRERRCAGPPSAETPDTLAGQRISALQFTQSLLHLSRARIELHAAGLEARRRCPDDDVAWWEATLALNRTLRHGGTGPQAAMAAHLAAQAVLAAATRTGLGLNPDVAAVARSAGEAARAVAATDLNTTAAGYLTRGWEDILTGDDAGSRTKEPPWTRCSPSASSARSWPR